MGVDKITQAHVSEIEPQAKESSAAETGQIAWVIAALLESLILTGGLYWAMQASPGPGLFTRILLVVALAVLGAAGFALAVAVRFRSGR